MPSILPAPSEVTQAFHQELHPGQQTALISWLAFTATFSGVRVLTISIKDGKGPFHNVTPRGLHLHHYLWGILIVSSVGALRGEDRFRRHPAAATAYGFGLALIVDEFALLLDLKDVYWERQGRVSVDVAVSLIAATGSLLAGGPVLRRLRRNRKA
jgi:hypothetical protein